MGELLNKANLRRLAACALWLGVWQAASLLLGSELLLAGPLATCKRLLAIIADVRFAPIVWFSFSRVAAGFLSAFVLGAALGFLAYRFSVLRELLAPVVLSFKSIPVACIVVLLLIWVGSREVSGICVFLMAFPALYLSMVEALGQVDVKVSQMLEVFEVPAARRFLAHVWPSVLPYLMATSRNACGMAWKAGVAAELIGSPIGSIGERIYQAKILLETADLFAWTAIIVAISYACEWGFLWLLQATGSLSIGLSVPRSTTHASEELSLPGRIELADATIGHDGVPVRSDVEISLDASARGVLGDASGTGKTTLLHTVAGLLPLIAGSMSHPQHLSMVFQETRLVEALSAEENVRLVGAGPLAPEQVRKLLLEILPVEALARPVRELSGGQRRRVEIARALAHPSGAVLLDEPFSSLDEENHRLAADFVVRHLAGRTLLVASHTPEDSTLLGARVIDALS